MARLVVDGMSVLKTVVGQAAHLDRGYSYSFMIQLNAAVKKLSPSGVDVCWEGGHQKRTALLPGYKSNRTGSGEEFRTQRQELQTLLSHLGVDQYVAPGHEADDMIASLVNNRPGTHVIMSGDKDMLQLVSDTVSVYQKVRTSSKKSERQLITKRNFQEKTGWYNPATFLKAHCALGDDVDCIPKVAGVGVPMIHGYFMGMEIPPKKREILDDFFNNSPQYLLNRKLIDLTGVGPLEHEFTPGTWNEGHAFGLLKDLGFASIVAKFDTWIVPWYEACANADVSPLP